MMRLLICILRLKRCPYCRDWSPFWCNRRDWYGDGNDCSWRQFR
jgi:hypothetical protein